MITITVDSPKDIEKALAAFHIAVGGLVLQGIDGIQSVDIVWKDPTDNTPNAEVVHLIVK